MTVTAHSTMGDTKNLLLSQLLRKPVLKDSVRSFLAGLDPDSGSRLVNTVLWQDPEVILSILASLPAYANLVIRLLDEVLVQISEKFPPDLFDGYIKSLVDDIDKESLERLKINFQKFMDVFLKNYRDWLAVAATDGRGRKGVDNG